MTKSQISVTAAIGIKKQNKTQKPQKRKKEVWHYYLFIRAH